ncbi:MAG: hypothetical protein EXR74_04075 [Bdellovibrionales bacterium]|nr:hypothetical protein [Bdellovibrionales bacterium]
MFQFQLLIKWLIATITAALFLVLLPFSQREVATERLNSELSKTVELTKIVSDNCRELISNENTPLERWFIGKLNPQPSVSRSPLLPSCVLRAQSAHSSQLNLRAQWNLGFEIFNSTSLRPLITKSYATQFPLPLCFLPLLAFILMLPFSAHLWGAITCLVLHLFFLSGLNLIELLKNLPKIPINILATDRLFPGLFLFSLWIALLPLHERKRGKTASNRIEILVNSFFNNLLGIWNPILYTLVSPIIFSVGNEIKKLTLFLNSQLLILALSLYIFGLDLSNIYSVFTTFLTPRYFSFSIFFCFFLSLVPLGHNNQILIWEIKNFWRYFIAVIVIESLAFMIADLRAIPTLTRWGLAFLLVEFLRFKWDHWNAIYSRWKPSLIALLISSSVAAFCSEVGVIDLVISICDPQKHPTSILPFTLLSGFLLGFLTGGLSSPFFILVSQLIQTYPDPLIRAALFDGVLAGLIFSPFSLFNLFPAMQNKISIQKLLRLRFKQLLIPILMGIVIYFVGTVTTLGILAPVCFVFCCLIVITFKLKKLRWKIDTFGATEHSEPR